MYQPPPVSSGPDQPLAEQGRTLLPISAIVLTIALVMVGLCAAPVGELMEPRRHNNGIAYGALICVSPFLTGGALLAILLLFQWRSRERVHMAGYAAGCLASPVLFMLISALAWGILDASKGIEGEATDVLVEASAHSALLAARIGIVSVTAICILIALGVTRLFRRRQARRW